LSIVSDAVAGGSLQAVATSAHGVLGRPVVIAIPALGYPIVCPAGSVKASHLALIIDYAAALMRGEQTPPPSVIGDSAPVRISGETVGLVAVGHLTGPAHAQPDERAWLEAAAAAAAVTALLQRDPEGSRRALMRALSAGPPADIEAFIAQARWLGIELGTGAVAIVAQRAPDDESDALPSVESGLLVDVGDGRVLGVVPLDATPPFERRAEGLATELSARRMTVALSARRRDAVSLHEALREAELMLELARQPEAMLAGHPETYRLLIGILLRDPETLEDLRASTVSVLGRYDAEHDTDLLATLQAFLAHDGSTTETAEALHLHRHTVGYRLTRVHEVSGLSLYESGGRERLSLGLKAHYILEAGSRRPNHA